MGAIASGGVLVMNPMAGATASAEEVAAVVEREQAELVRRERLYRGDGPAVSLRGRNVIVVDDGLATGSTMRAAVQAIRKQNPARVVVAVPVGADDTCELLRAEADEVVCVATPHPFRAVGLWYRDFPQASDDEVHELLEEARREHALIRSLTSACNAHHLSSSPAGMCSPRQPEPSLTPDQIWLQNCCIAQNTGKGIAMLASGSKVVQLGTYKVKRGQSSVSGLSSGAFMTVQLHLAYSSSFAGAGIIAGGPFRCAESFRRPPCWRRMPTSKGRSTSA